MSNFFVNPVNEKMWPHKSTVWLTVWSQSGEKDGKFDHHEPGLDVMRQ